jgi:hypothetical protein
VLDWQLPALLLAASRNFLTCYWVAPVVPYAYQSLCRCHTVLPQLGRVLGCRCCWWRCHQQQRQQQQQQHASAARCHGWDGCNTRPLCVILLRPVQHQHSRLACKHATDQGTL